MEAETDATKGQESKQQIRDEELFKAAESAILRCSCLYLFNSSRNLSVSETKTVAPSSMSQLRRSFSGLLPLPQVLESIVRQKHYGLCCCKFFSDLSFTKEKKSDIKSVWLWDLQIVKLLSSVHESKTVINSKDDEG